MRATRLPPGVAEESILTRLSGEMKHSPSQAVMCVVNSASKADRHDRNTRNERDTILIAQGQLRGRLQPPEKGRREAC